MDPRTAKLFGVLKRPGAAFLLRLLEGPATEAELVQTDSEATQATTNRRLARMEELGLIERDPGEAHAPGRRWRLTVLEEVDAVLAAATELSATLSRREDAQREAAQRKLRRARARRRLRDASEGSA